MEKRHRYRDHELAQKVVDRIKELRSKSKVPQEAAIDQTHSDVYRYEAGRKVPNIMSIRKICEFYNITLREFFDTEAFDYPVKAGDKK